MYTQYGQFCLFLKKSHLPLHEEESSHFLFIFMTVKGVSPSGAILGSTQTSSAGQFSSMQTNIYT